MKFRASKRGSRKNIMADYWSRYAQADGKHYTCPWCSADLTMFTCGQNAKPENVGRSFVNCSNKDGKNGCGLYCFLDKVPNDKFKPKAGGEKRARTEGTIITGSVANAPTPAEDALARIQTDVTKLKGLCIALCEFHGIKFE